MNDEEAQARLRYLRLKAKAAQAAAPAQPTAPAPAPEGPGFLARSRDRLALGLSDVGSTLTGQTYGRDGDPTRRDSMAPSEYVMKALGGDAIPAVGGVIADAVVTAGKAVLPESAEDAIAEGVQTVAQSAPVQAVGRGLEAWRKASPRTYAQAGEIANVVTTTIPVPKPARRAPQFTTPKRRVAESLIQPDGSFKPIHLADQEGWRGALYRDTFGRIPFARRELLRQEAPFLEAANREVAQLTDDAALRADAIKSTYTTNTRAARDAHDAALDTIKADTASALPQVKRAAEQRAAANTAAWRGQKPAQALPAHAQGVLDGVDPTDIEAAGAAVQDWWLKNAFREVKDRPFEWRGDVDADLRQAIRAKLAADPDLALKASGVVGQIEGMVERLKRAGMTDNTGAVPQDFIEEMLKSTKITAIDGDALMAIRNTFATAANKGGGRPPREIANEIDNMIRSQLDDASRDAFNDTLDKYTTALTLTDLLRRPKVKERFGAFTEGEWNAAASKYGGKGMSTKQAPLVDETRNVNATTRRLADSDADVKAVREAGARRLKQARQQYRNRQRALDDAKRTATEALDADKRYGPLAKAKETLTHYKKSAVPQRVSPWSAIASTVAIPAVLGSAGTGIGVLGAGVAGARLAATKNAQLLLAGQLPRQKILADALRAATSPAERATILAAINQEKEKRHAARQ